MCDSVLPHVYFCEIPAGHFWMGGDLEAHGMPRHGVDLAGFQMSAHLITVAQYAQYCRVTGSTMPTSPEFNPAWQKRDHPIVNVSWYEAIGFCDWLSEQSGTLIDLPTEAEWEYACCGGAEPISPCGEVEGSPVRVRTTPMGRYAANGYGLYDMLGNVWEWCRDWYDVNGVAPTACVNPQGADDGVWKVIRGGVWEGDTSNDLRWTRRDWYFPDFGQVYLGFRVVCRTSDASC